MGKLVADYLNIQNDGGVIKDLDGNILAVGTLLQTVSKSIDTSSNIDVDNGEYLIDSDLNVDITLKDSNSKLLIIFNPSSEVDTDIDLSTVARCKVFDSDGNKLATTGDNQLSWRDDDTNSGSIMFKPLSHGADVGDTVTVKAYVAARADNDGKMQFGQYGEAVLTVQEVL